ncbi:disaggregatase related repeat-containing protein [Methanosarcina sp. UBA5]|uniref:disaggregatase related repeat-containing protein n=1 Tax=Methanosarcina sp. UBA5 TaxID=1915593 RepID=UPI0025FC71E6|nr:disaggregatase related repeat-containing protein [Methanosarcina sp. UBA5]
MRCCDQAQVISTSKGELGLLLLVGCLILVSIPTASCRSPSPTVYVAGDGSGDFNCDGKDDHIQINQALKFVADNSEYTTVHLKGPFTYVIDDTLLIGSNTILEGDSTAVIKLVDHAGWVPMKPLIQQMSNFGNNNIVIRGFEVNVNHDGNTEFAKGKGYYNVIYFLYCKNVTVCDMYMHDGHGDGLRIKYGENVQFYNNTIYKLGHDGLFAIQCQNVEAWNNTITCRTNSGLRIWNSNHVKFHDNVIDSFYHWSAGGPGIQVEKSAGIMDDVEIYNNTIHNTYCPGIWLFNYDSSSATKDQAKNVYIHHNTFYDTGTNPSVTWVGGIIAGGFEDTVIENNIFDGIYHTAIANMYINSYSPTYVPEGDGFTTIVRNNIIVNAQKRTKDPSGTGYGIINYLPETHSFVLENNCLYNNSAGDYKNCTSTTDIYVNPLFADSEKHDYHLQSVSGRWDEKTWVKDKVHSPCIDAGYPFSNYSNEPEDNGNRINIGRYGNTIYASLSRDNHAPVLDSIPETTVKIGDNLSFIVKASDADGDNLTYSASVLPVGASFDGKSRLFSWTPSDGQEGLYAIYFKVSDGKLNDSGVAKISVVKEIPLNFSGEMYDNRMREASPEDIFSDKPFLDVGGMSGVGKYRDLIWFNVSEYTNNTEISSATLSLFWYYPSNSRPNDTIIEVYKPVAWNPDYVSWNKKNKDIAWNNAGGDWYDKNGILLGSTPYATLTLKSSSLPDNRYYELNVTDLVKEYVSGKSANMGFLIKARNESDNYIAFYSADCGNTSQAPKLNITKRVATNATIIGAKDNRLRETSPEDVFSDTSYIDVGGLGSVGRYRDVILFNLSEYPSAIEVNSATLSLFWYHPSNSRPNDTVIEVYRPVAWNPDYVSWNKKNKDVAWNNAGGDWYDRNGVLLGSTPYATLILKASSLPDNRYYELNVTDLVKEYVSGKSANTGFLIKARNESDNYIAFYSADCENKSQVPKLNLVYK